MNLIWDLRRQLQRVSLLVPEAILNDNMQGYYGAYITPKLLTKWQNAPLDAPGWKLSSPWPQRIEILNIDETSSTLYKVKGEVIKVTSSKIANGCITTRRPSALNGRSGQKPVYS